MATRQRIFFLFMCIVLDIDGASIIIAKKMLSVKALPSSSYLHGDPKRNKKSTNEKKKKQDRCLIIVGNKKSILNLSKFILVGVGELVQRNKETKMLTTKDQSCRQKSYHYVPLSGSIASSLGVPMIGQHPS